MVSGDTNAWLQPNGGGSETHDLPNSFDLPDSPNSPDSPDSPDANHTIGCQVMRTHGFNPSEEDLKDMIRNVDTNSNGAIDFNEFIDMMVKRGNNVEEDVAHAFKVFDRDGDGLITAEELRLTMNNLGEPITEEEVKAMIAEADIDGDGKINFAEFKSLIANKAL